MSHFSSRLRILFLRHTQEATADHSLRFVPHLSINQPVPPEQTELQWRRKRGRRGLGYSQHGHEGTFLPPTRHCSSGNICSKAAWEKCLESQKRGKNRKIPHSSQVIFDLGSDKALTLYQCTTEPLTKYVEQKKSSGIT